MHRFMYKIGGTEIVVRGRPKHLEIGAKTVEEDDPCDAYLSVTDTFVVAPQGKIFVWFPWNEGRSPIPEMYYATNRVLHWWIHYQKLKRVCIFCDGGSHRSVTVFGAYLRTYLKSDQARDVVAARVDLAGKEPEAAVSWAQPLEYVDSYLRQHPADALLFKAMSEDYLGRLDNHSSNIYRLVKERYAVSDSD